MLALLCVCGWLLLDGGGHHQTKGKGVCAPGDRRVWEAVTMLDTIGFRVFCDLKSLPSANDEYGPDDRPVPGVRFTCSLLAVVVFWLSVTSMGSVKRGYMCMLHPRWRRTFHRTASTSRRQHLFKTHHVRLHRPRNPKTRRVAVSEDFALHQICSRVITPRQLCTCSYHSHGGEPKNAPYPRETPCRTTYLFRNFKRF